MARKAKATPKPTKEKPAETKKKAPKRLVNKPSSSKTDDSSSTAVVNPPANVTWDGRKIVKVKSQCLRYFSFAILIDTYTIVHFQAKIVHCKS